MTIYSIIDRPAWNNGIWKEVAQEYDTARRSLDGTKVVVKWESKDGPPSRLPDGAPLYYHPDSPPDDTRGFAGSIFDALTLEEWGE